ncbi:thioredoxin, mitochondrial [Neocloeon triangulifer]|uniref:thioredoxin, mitochondrial n=1 Tax=Neocloeon triangulifer TaxID=2078957 RepID=UPI00286F2A41|nr:thioredoxin, mitochondrial [Neocloeon triangulifer]XP_059479941.1 thioredoxin, mitochondrial [Neocloeon triangulifer]
MLSIVACRAFSTTARRLRKIFTVSDSETFMDKVLNNDVPVIVNFHAEWCDPCKLLTPKLEELVLPLPGIDLAVVDVEACPELVHAFEVKAVPAVIAVRSGLVVDKFIGLVDAKNIEDFIMKLSKQSQPPQS